MNIKLNLGDILTQAWKITWKFKILWVFGIRAGCASNSNGGGNFKGGSSGGGGGGNGNGNGADFPGGEQLSDFFRRFENLRPEQALQALLEQYLWIIVAVILALCLLWFLFYALGIMGRVGLIKGIGKADGGAESLTFGEIWGESLPYFWRMFGLWFLVGLPFFLLVLILLVVLGAGLFTAIQGGGTEGGIAAMLGGTMLFFFCLLCVIGILGIFVNLILEQSQNAIVLEDLGVLASLGRGWEVFRQNWLTVIVVGLILWVIGIVVGLIIAIPLMVAAIPIGVMAVAAAANDSWLVLVVIGLACCAVFLPFSLLLGGVEQTYFQAVWTLAYRRLTTLTEPAPAIPAPLENLEPQ